MAEQWRAAGRVDTEDTEDELLYQDLDDAGSVFGLQPPTVKPDHCDLLLDAIDAQLSQLRVQRGEPGGSEPFNAGQAFLGGSRSLSKDTGFGSATQIADTPTMCLDTADAKARERMAEASSTSRRGPVPRPEPGSRSRGEEKAESRREQVIWRLEKLLGDACGEGQLAGDAQLLSDSVRTEDFVQRFSKGMVDLTLPQQRRRQLLSTQGDAGSVATSDRAGLQRGRGGRGGATSDGRSSRDEPKTRTKLKQACEGHDAKTAGGRHEESNQLGGDRGASHRHTEAPTDGESRQPAPKVRSLAGVPVWSFDTVSIDSDLDSVSTQQVRQHISRAGWRSLFQVVTDVDGICGSHGYRDTPMQEEERDPQLSAEGRGHSRDRDRDRGRRRSTARLACSGNMDDEDTDEEQNIWSRRSRPEKTSWEQLERRHQPGEVKMKERLCDLQQRCEEEEETLRLRRKQLAGVEEKREQASQELRRLSAETERMEKERRRLEARLRESRAEQDAVSRQLCQLQREQRLRERGGGGGGRGLRTEDVPAAVVSVLEREETERQLDAAKAQLFAEQRRAREERDSLQERLEETREELHRATEGEGALRSSCALLEEQQRSDREKIQALELRVQQLVAEAVQAELRLQELQAQKELQLEDVQERHKALETNWDGLRDELRDQEARHRAELTHARDEARRAAEAELQRQRGEMTRDHQRQIQKIQEEKLSSLREQALSITHHIHSLQLNEEKAETPKSFRSPQQQQGALKSLVEQQQHQEALEEVHKALEELRRRWEAETEEAAQVHSGKLLEESRRSLESARSETERERENVRALQRTVAGLQETVRDMEAGRCAQQREQEAVLAAICKSLKGEHEAELQRAQRREEQSQQAALRLQQAAQLAEVEAATLRAVLEERAGREERAAAELRREHGVWAQELQAECQHLLLLLQPGGEKLPPSPTVAMAITNLRAVRERLKVQILHLRQELDSQKQEAEQQRRDQEQELNNQGQRLRMERDQALDSLKERLIQEHIEELSSLSRAHAGEGGDEGGGVAACLRRQLKVKDEELRQVQRSMSEWKRHTAAKLACKFEEELTAELERCRSELLMGRRTPEDDQRTPEIQMQLNKNAQNGNIGSHPQAFAPRERPRAVAASPGPSPPSDVASLKLLRYLQGRIGQLRVENRTYVCSPSPAR